MAPSLHSTAQQLNFQRMTITLDKKLGSLQIFQMLAPILLFVDSRMNKRGLVERGILRDGNAFVACRYNAFLPGNVSPHLAAKSDELKFNRTGQSVPALLALTRPHHSESRR